jgi:flavin-dependent dehydrogenase
VGLRRAGADVVVIDRATFPRDKVCAGWVTPAVVAALALDTEDYRRGRTFQPITAFRTGRIDVRARDVETRYERPVSFGIRRCEFDHYLLCRSGAEVRPATPLESLRREGGRWIVNDEIESPVLVGAGGHFCPVARHLGGGGGGEPIVAAQEFEVPLAAEDCRCGQKCPRALFRSRPQGLRLVLPEAGRDERRLRTLWRRPPVGPRGRLPGLPAPARAAAGERDRRLKGHAYLLYDTTPRPLVGDGVLLVGDAAGLAYAPSGEGIRTAVESGLLAAQTIREARGAFDGSSLEPYRSRVEARFGRRRSGGGLTRLVPSRVVEALGAGLLASSWLTRRIVLDRWFLHAHQPALSLAGN